MICKGLKEQVCVCVCVRERERVKHHFNETEEFRNKRSGTLRRSKRQACLLLEV